MDKIRIMIADDHALLRAGLRSLLSEQEDMELVAEATDGVEAIEKAKEVQPDVLVLDITMPRKTGIDALGDIRRKCPKTNTCCAAAWSFWPWCILDLAHSDPKTIH